MTKQVINVGTAANDKKGDSLRAAFQKVNTNFTELYTALGINADVDLNLGAFEFTGSTISTTDSTAIVIDQATTVTSNLSVGGDIVPQTANGGDLGSSTLPWRSLYVSNNTIYIGGTAVGLDASNNLTVNGSQVTGGSVSSLVNGSKTVSLGSTGILTLPNGAVIRETAGDAVAFGQGAGETSQGEVAVAIGNVAGQTTQGAAAVAVGAGAGQTSQGVHAVAVGTDSGATSQGNRAVAIGYLAGSNNQGTHSVAIGYYAGELNQANNSIIINATGSDLQQTTANTFTVAPIRNIGGTSGVLQYNAATKEVSYSSDIRSEGNINIEVNLTDSTKYIWQFGEDGNLTLPQGGNIAEGGGISGAIKLTPAGGANEYQALLIYPTAGEGDHIHLTAGGGTTELYLGDDLHYVKLASDGNVRIQADNGVNGAAWTFGTDGALTIPGDIRSEGNINIDVNLSDSTLRRWQFGEDGSLTLPSVGKINNGAYDWTFGSTGITTFPGVINAGNINNLVVNDLGGGTSQTAGSQVQIGNSAGIAGAGVLIKNAVTNALGGETELELGSKIQMDNGIVSLSGYDYNGLGGGDGLEFRMVVEVENNYPNKEVRIGARIINTIEGSTINVFQGFTISQYGELTFPDNTVQTTAWTGFSVAADDSTQRLINADEVVKFVGAGGITTSSDDEGNITITGNTGAITAETFNTDQITIVGNRMATTVTNANLEIECNGTGGVVINTLADATTASTTKSVGYLGLPQSATATTATLAIGDAGKHIYITTTAQTITIPAAASVAYPIGTTLTFIAGPSATTTTIAITSDTLRLAGGTSTGSRTLAANGMATAVKVASTTWYINGIGLT